MDNQIRVRVRDRVQHLEKQAQARAQIEPMLLAVLIDRLSVDVFEDQVRRPRRRDAGIDELRDVRMDQAAEDGALRE